MNVIEEYERYSHITHLLSAVVHDKKQLQCRTDSSKEWVNADMSIIGAQSLLAYEWRIKPTPRKLFVEKRALDKGILPVYAYDTRRSCATNQGCDERSVVTFMEQP